MTSRRTTAARPRQLRRCGKTGALNAAEGIAVRVAVQTGLKTLARVEPPDTLQVTLQVTFRVPAEVTARIGVQVALPIPVHLASRVPARIASPTAILTVLQTTLRIASRTVPGTVPEVVCRIVTYAAQSAPKMMCSGYLAPIGLTQPCRTTKSGHFPIFRCPCGVCPASVRSRLAPGVTLIPIGTRSCPKAGQWPSPAVSLLPSPRARL